MGYFVTDNNKRIGRAYRVTEGEWRRADLHLHTPASADWLEPGVTYLQWLQKAESRGLNIVAITDHNTVEGVAQLRAEIERLAWLEANDRLRPQERRDLDEYRRLGDNMLVLPGFEFTATFGFHVLGIFPPETPIRKLELLLLRLNVPVDKISEGSTEVGASADVLTAYRLIREAGGLVIAAHVNSAHGVAMRGLSFGGQTKIAFTQDPNLHALEVTDLDNTSRRATAKFFDGSKPEYPRRMHCVQGSDAHRLTHDPKDKNRPGIGDRIVEVCLSELSFEVLKQILESDDFSRVRPYRIASVEPFDPIKAAREQGSTIVQSFHESIEIRGGRLNKVLTDVVAFANTQGGTVYVGVSASRKGVPRGLPNPNEAVSMLRREIERQVTPPLEARVDVLQSQDVPVVRVIVPNGSDKPYALEQTRIYVRQEGETNEAVRDEIVQLVLGQRRQGNGLPSAAAVSNPGSSPRYTKPAPQPVGSGAAVTPPPSRQPVASQPPSRQPAQRPTASRQPAMTQPPAAVEHSMPQSAQLPVATQPPVQPPTEVQPPAGVQPVVPTTAAEQPPVADHMPVAEHPLLSQPVELESATTQPIAAEQSPVSQPVETLPVAVEPMVMSAGGDEEDVVAEGVPDDLASAELAAPANLTNGNGNGDGPPAVGVEVLSTEDRKGTKYFSIRDLRNGNVIHNVSLTSARKLWSYAINQHQTNPVNPGKVTWNGDIGLWQVARRAKKLRYDLVLRQSDGHMRVFYGVTADGMLGHWQQFLKDEDKAE
jgi:Putative DNA-binding domain